jgi:hypothetical protein
VHHRLMHSRYLLELHQPTSNHTQLNLSINTVLARVC